MNNILIAVRDDKVAAQLATACQDRGANTFRALGATQALPEISAEANGSGKGPKWTGLLLDLAYGQAKPLDLVSSFIEANPDLKIVALAKNMEIKNLTALMRLGVYDFLELPPEPLELAGCLDKFLGRLGPGKETPSAVVAPPPSDPARFAHIVGQSAALKKVFKMVDKVATTDSTVMIHGESGTGKELIARAVHQASLRANNPLIPVNCGAIPEELLEAELFGHEKGAFTNAIRTRIGRFEMADGGSIFLDEIGDMSPKLQVKLLRVLQEHEIERVGGDKVIPVDIRVITATHVDLAQAVEEGRFREDLFYRLNVIPVTMPPLRDRLVDLPLLIVHFLQKFQKSRASDVIGMNRETLERLWAYNWPGNVRELENLIERMVTLADENILTLEDLPPKLLDVVCGPLPADFPDLTELTLDYSLSSDGTSEGLEVSGETGEREVGPEVESAEEVPTLPVSLSSSSQVSPAMMPLGPETQSESWSFPPEGLDFNALVSAYEEKLIRGALECAGGVKNQAAKLLGLNRTTLVEKMRKKGITGGEEN